MGIYLDRKNDAHGFLWDDGKYRTIDVRGAEATFVLGINDRGQMVGSYIDDEGAYHGFVRGRHGRVTTLPDVPGGDPTMGGTQPANINNRGQIVGLTYDSQGGSRGFLMDDGEVTMIDAAPDAVFTRPLDINNRGRIVGDYGTVPPAGARSASVDPAERRADSSLLDRLGLGAVAP